MKLLFARSASEGPKFGPIGPNASGRAGLGKIRSQGGRDLRFGIKNGAMMKTKNIRIWILAFLAAWLLAPVLSKADDGEDQQFSTAPLIVKQPQDDAAPVGGRVVLRVGAYGASAYQWLFNGEPISGATGSRLVLGNLQPSQEGGYSVQVANAVGTTTSATASVVVVEPIVVQQQPESEVVDIDEPVVLRVVATGHPAPRYQWRLNGDIIPGATDSTYTISAAQASSGGKYSVALANDYEDLDSDTPEVRVRLADLAFGDDLSQKGSISGLSGHGVGDNSAASKEASEPALPGKKSIHSVWTGWVAPADGVVTFTTEGSSFDTLLGVFTGSAGALALAAWDDDSGSYHSSVVNLTVNAGVAYTILIDGDGGQSGRFALNWNLLVTSSRLPAITQQPVGQTVNRGQAVNLSVGYDHDAGILCQWYKGGQPVPGATSSSLVLGNIADGDVGIYTAQLSNGDYTVSSMAAEVQINTEGSKAAARNKLWDAQGAGIRPAGVTANSSGSKLKAKGRITPRDIAGSAGYSGTQIFTTAYGKDPDEPNACGIVGGSSFWLTYTAPESGVLSMNTDGSNYDTVMGIYVDNGSNQGYASLVPVTCNNNGGIDGVDSSVVFSVTASTVYYVMIDGVNAATGTVYLNYLLNATPTITAISNRSVNEDTSTGAIAFTIGDHETAASSLTVTATSGTTSIVANSGLTLGGSGASRTLTVMPVANANGHCNITVKVTDGVCTNSTTFDLNVLAVNDSPTAGTDSGTRLINNPISFSTGLLLANDTDVDGDSLTITGVTSPTSHGATVIKSGTTITYYPPYGYNSPDYFNYTISDGHGGTATGRVNIFVTY